MTAEPLTCQDWYRVRRGEDEIAWGKTHADPQLPHVLFSERSSQKLAFLTEDQQRVVDDCLKRLSAQPDAEHGAPVSGGANRRLMHAGPIRIVFRCNAAAAQIEISTIRGGKVVDPENVGPAPRRPA